MWFLNVNYDRKKEKKNQCLQCGSNLLSSACYGPYIKAEGEKQIAARAVLKILLALHEDVKIIA